MHGVGGTGHEEQQGDEDRLCRGATEGGRVVCRLYFDTSFRA